MQQQLMLPLMLLLLLQLLLLQQSPQPQLPLQYAEVAAEVSFEGCAILCAFL